MTFSASTDQNEILQAIRLLRAADRRFRSEVIGLFHHYLAFYVTGASPLLVDLATHWGLDLTTALRRLRPLAGWPFGDGRRGMARYYGAKRGHAGRWRAPIRSAIDPIVAGPRRHESLMVCLDLDTLNVRARLGAGTMCVAFEDVLRVVLPMQLPETLAVSMLGWRLADVVDHPVFRLREYRILSACAAGHHSVIEVEAPAVPFAMPWRPSLNKFHLPTLIEAQA